MGKKSSEGGSKSGSENKETFQTPQEEDTQQTPSSEAASVESKGKDTKKEHTEKKKKKKNEKKAPSKEHNDESASSSQQPPAEKEHVKDEREIEKEKREAADKLKRMYSDLSHEIKERNKQILSQLLFIMYIHSIY